jgi:hypothetical protein
MEQIGLTPRNRHVILLQISAIPPIRISRRTEHTLNTHYVVAIGGW